MMLMMLMLMLILMTMMMCPFGQLGLWAPALFRGRDVFTSFA
jgi:hypothetical protein